LGRKNSQGFHLLGYSFFRQLIEVVGEYNTAHFHTARFQPFTQAAATEVDVFDDA
jgi:hypothetical protein